jgi:xylose isomerase
VLTGKLGLDAVAQRVLDQNADVQPVSGRQERIENLLNSYI